MLATIHSLRGAAPAIKKASVATCVRLLATQTAKTGRSDKDYAAKTRQLFQDTRPALPRFVVQGETIKPILTPSKFYSEMKDHIKKAQKSITLAALYLGHTENDLVEALSEALRSRPGLKLNLLLDSLRGTRDSGKGSSASLLYPLLKAYPDQVRVSMYHTPDLSGFLKQVMPPRFNEGIGLMHMKVYAFDDTLIMSGANMSHDYFTNRQDRYIMFNNKDISEYYCDLVNVVSSLSYGLQDMGDTFQLKIGNGIPDPVEQSKDFKKHATKTMRAFLKKWASIQQSPKDASYDTTLHPLIQMGPLGLRQDERVTLSVLDHVLHAQEQDGPAKVFITSGYFNFEKRYSQSIIHTKAANVGLIAASPEANGFFNSAGISKYIPPAYTLIEQRFFNDAKAAGNADRITIEEYLRKGWTYHAKGMWVYPPHSDLPVMTTIGSPNFGYRSIVRDLEAQLFLVTSNVGLRKSLHEELSNLRKYAHPVTEETFKAPDRQVPVWVGGASRAIRTML
ncbi:CDP-diacylglycerol--glycerol-3-phosphate 3-phosphatidyltransferase [Mortierella sp. GBA35]|nr:CDP-diacylglycerol--glycerol-3-phosphate 3-phosphatidyltransferase [Mortierella sp. AD031]KAF9090776.1 CDP-diacylglycerol--glycerol-3-phosphate 3-phosphatidyltransferase [Mortierella sp. GBA35]KAG0200366.1 CDP-diacylglycerol--glycerol-3-phosphate 3-phosphatidyltransferase [Mortierella sp. NVP41]